MQAEGREGKEKDEDHATGEGKRMRKEKGQHESILKGELPGVQ
jgi:hypothetical protein